MALFPVGSQLGILRFKYLKKVFIKTSVGYYRPEYFCSILLVNKETCQRYRSIGFVRLLLLVIID